MLSNTGKEPIYAKVTCLRLAIRSSVTVADGMSYSLVHVSLSQEDQDARNGQRTS